MDQLSRHEERIRNRRTRRWKRRFRILAPIAALPLLFTTLVLSVDLVEYAPQEPRVQPDAVAKIPLRPPLTGAHFDLNSRAALQATAVDQDDPLDDEPFDLNDFDSGYAERTRIPKSLADRMPR